MHVYLAWMILSHQKKVKVCVFKTNVCVVESRDVVTMSTRFTVAFGNMVVKFVNGLQNAKQKLANRTNVG